MTNRRNMVGVFDAADYPVDDKGALKMKQRRNWNFEKCKPRPSILLVRIDPSNLYRRALNLGDGWACTHIHHKLWKPKSQWGKYTAEPLPDGGWYHDIHGPVVLCGRCSLKRGYAGFVSDHYPKSTPEQIEAYQRAITAGAPPLASKAKAGGK
jgi:hypothetical protein